MIIYNILNMTEKNKIVKALMDASVIVGLTAGIGYVGKKILKENLPGGSKFIVR